MKSLLILLFMLITHLLISQKTIQMSETLTLPSYSMDEVTGRTTNGIYRYYVVGEEEPYTGILYGNHPNGNLASWQEYEYGVGQGKWINYYKNGNIKEVGTYEQNRVEGPIQKFYSNGQLKAEGTYKDWRIKVGLWTYYDSIGVEIKQVNYGEKGSIEEVTAYYNRGEIGYSWYAQILRDNGFEIK